MRLGYRVPFLAAMFCLCSLPATAQWLYVSQDPIDCTVEMAASIVRGSYTLYLYAPDHAGATGAYFRLEVDDLGSEDEVVVTPEPGVTISGDARTGMAATFSPRGAGHEPILSVSFVDHAPVAEFFPSGYVFIGVRDALLVHPGGTIPMENMDAVRFHCYGSGGLDFQPPATPHAVIGRTTMITFTGVSSGGYYGPGATNMTADDTAGWVESMPSNSLWNSGCGKCPWLWETLSIVVTVPDATLPGATSLVTISEGAFALTQFSLTAIEPTATEPTTWGAIKALYR